ncbi:zona pellucida sperm-binding protein 4-like [Heptranchias perlo]|uniref:zona pellucida sperm-binding protein 4-like n=1 Tax=Heptranchias perlo TaxID=212740 RepID=UPI00355A22FB
MANHSSKINSLHYEGTESFKLQVFNGKVSNVCSVCMKMYRKHCQLSAADIPPFNLPQITAQPPSFLFPADKCWLSPKNRKDCGFPGIEASECVQRGCCFDAGNRDAPPCFYSLDSLPVCTKDGQVLIAISKDLTLPPVNLTTVHLKEGDGAECSPTVASADTVLFQFAVTECGATQRLDGVNILYETDVLGEFEILDGALGSVTRDSPFRLHVQCSYRGSQESDLQVKPRVYTLSPPLPATEAGILLLELRIARGNECSLIMVATGAGDYPILSVLRDPVFVEVRVLNRNDPSLVLVLNDCWATPTPEPYSGIRWDLLVERCPFAGDNYKTRLLPVNADSHLRFPTHHNRFVVSTFAFWDRVSGRALTGEVYFHCSAEVCYPSTRENCTAPCSPKRRRSVDNRSGALVTADGPILFLEGEERLAARIHQDEKASHGCSKQFQPPTIRIEIQGKAVDIHQLEVSCGENLDGKYSPWCHCGWAVIRCLKRQLQLPASNAEYRKFRGELIGEITGAKRGYENGPAANIKGNPKVFHRHKTQLSCDGAEDVKEAESESADIIFIAMTGHVSTGPDDIHPRVFKEMRRVLCEPLACIFNSSVESAIVS